MVIRKSSQKVYEKTRNIYLFGNGLDLSYSLPTKYIDFIYTVNALVSTPLKECVTVGKIFSKIAKKHRKGSIAKSYNKYKVVYDKICLPHKEILAIKEESKRNMWFNYLTKALNEDVGWIDFEKEISKVLEAFHILFDLNKNQVKKFCIPRKRKDVVYIADLFNYYQNRKVRGIAAFFQKVRTLMGFHSFYLSEKYLKEEPFSSGNKIVDKEKIMKELFESLEQFSEMLKLYLNLFVEKTIKEINPNIFTGFMLNADVVTLNYTKTLELILENMNILNKPPIRIFHLHGSTDGRIVLGVNSDIYDELENMDSSFLFFKKYYQRIIYKTDRDYINFLEELKRDKKTNKKVFVYGHSLDITDKDIIKELFNVANEICVFYHNIESLEGYIKNLVTIFGKRNFDKIRSKKFLSFIDQHSLSDNDKKRIW